MERPRLDPFVNFNEMRLDGQGMLIFPIGGDKRVAGVEARGQGQCAKVWECTMTRGRDKEGHFGYYIIFFELLMSLLLRSVWSSFLGGGCKYCSTPCYEFDGDRDGTALFYMSIGGR